MDQADRDELMRLRRMSRLQSGDISSLKNLYDKYINCRLHKVIDWRCPNCIRDVRDELINYEASL